MPGPITHGPGLHGVTNTALAGALTPIQNNGRANRNQQQLAFNSAFEIIRRGMPASSLREAWRTLNLLATVYDRTWNTGWPTSTNLTRNISESNINNNGNAALPRRTRYPNVVHRVYSKWRRGPVQLVPLPNNAPKAPISLHNFKKGHEAIRHTRRNATGRSANRYYTVKEFENLTGKSWSTIYRMKPSNIVVEKDPLNRQRIYRRNLTLVKFV